MHSETVRIIPGDKQTDPFENLFSQAFHFRRSYYQEKVECEVMEQEFDREGFLRRYKDNVKERFPNAKLNLNVFDAMADLMDLGEIDVKGMIVAFSKGIQTGRQNLWLPLFHVIPTDIELSEEARGNPPDYLIVSKDGLEYWATLIWEAD